MGAGEGGRGGGKEGGANDAATRKVYEYEMDGRHLPELPLRRVRSTIEVAHFREKIFLNDGVP